jgi:malonyl CoA-acyl carrier protein transacylase
MGVMRGRCSFEDGLKIVKARGEAMQAAADAQPSGMVSVIGLDAEKTTALCERATAEVRVSVCCYHDRPAATAAAQLRRMIRTGVTGVL